MPVHHIIDPRGEVTLIVRNPNPPFAEVTPADGSSGANDTNAEPSTEPSTGPSVSEPDTDGNQNEVRIQVSAKHLTFGSPVFNSMLDGNWKKSAESKAKGYLELVVRDWDVEALLMVLHIMHAQTSKVPRMVTLEEVAKVTVAADYYDVKEVELLCDVWLWLLESSFSQSAVSSRDTILLVWVAYATRCEDTFAKYTTIAIEQATAPISALGLPIPAGIIDEMNRRRTEAIQSSLELLDSSRNTLLDTMDGAKEEGGSGCTVECAAMTYGQMSRSMRAFGLLPLRPNLPYIGLNNASFRVLNGVGVGYWGDHHAPFTTNFRPHKCSVSSGYSGMFQGLYRKIEPLSLSDYVPMV